MKMSLSLLILLTLFLTACGGQTQTSITGNYAGQVEGSNAFIGLVRRRPELQCL
jgi:hypothetical protein